MSEPLPSPSDETVELPASGERPLNETLPPPECEAVADAKSETVELDEQGSSRRAAPALSRSFASDRYEVVSELGRGGMGVVLAAHDKKLDRRVALKVLLAGDFASKEAQDRFQVEARAAARLSHRNLVGVHEVGEEGGVHFLVMDYVEGESLAERVKREGPLPPRDAAWIALRLADALYYAHTRAILHRDVKPANVLLDTRGEPLLTDFGLAKELDSVGPGLTASGFVIGTPAYMSPEQAGGTDQLDRRSDIYSLGATLYETLSGKPPFAAKNVAGLLRAVLEEEPAPFERADLDRDLETICLKCLEKEPTLRYGSARALQEDLERYLAHESILARRPGAVERARKWIRRNGLLARALGVTLVLGGLALALLTASFVWRLQHERNRARDIATHTRRSLELLVFEARDKLSTLPGERARQVRRELLREALRSLLALHETSEEVATFSSEAFRDLAMLAIDANELDSALELAQRGVAAVRRPAPGPLRDRNVALSLLVLGDVQRRLGRTEAALESNRAGCALVHPEPLPGEPVHEPAMLLLNGETRQLELLREAGRMPEALAMAEGIEQRLNRLPSEVASYEQGTVALQLGRIFEHAGEIPRARQAFQRTFELTRAALREAPGAIGPRELQLAALDNLTRLRRTQGDLEGALQVARQGVELGEALLREDPENASTRQHLVALRIELSDGLDAVGRLEDSLAPLRLALRDAQALARASPNDADSANYLAALLDRIAGLESRRGQLEAAQLAAQKSLAAAQGILERVPNNRSAQRAEANAIERLALLAERRGDLEAARAEHQRALEAREKLGQNRDDQLHVSVSRVHLADLATRQERFGDALEQLSAAGEIRARLHAQTPKDVDLLHALVMVHVKRGQVLYQTRKKEPAEASFAEAERYARQLLDLAPHHADGRRALGTVLVQQGDLHRDAKRLEQARACYRASADLRQELLRESPQDRDLVRAQEHVLSRLADLHQQAGEHDEARAAYAKVLEQQRARAKRHRDDAETRRDLLVGLVKLADLRIKAGEHEEAAVLLEEAREVGRELLERDPSNASAERDLVGVLTRLASTQMSRGKRREALAYFREAGQLYERRLARQESPRERRNLSAVWLKVADLQNALGDPLGARAYLRKVVANHEVLAAADARHRPQLDRLRQLLARQEHRCALLTGEARPTTPQEHVQVARSQDASGEHEAAVRSWRVALEDEQVRDDPRHLFEAARAAARAVSKSAGRVQANLRDQAFAWLKEEVERRRAQLAQLKELLKTAPQEDLDQLRDFQQGISAHLRDLAAGKEEALKSLESDPRWRVIFPR